LQEVDVVAVLMAGLVVAVVVTAALLGHLGWAGRAAMRCWHLVRPPRPVADDVPVEQIAADLRRLAAHLENVYRLDAPAKMQRLTAAALAYDWVLLSACRTLDVPVPGPAPLDPLDRLETEAALAAQGLDW
jgi:hypothetical protein